MSDGSAFLVTGALGCIGAWTVRELVRQGERVVAFDIGTDRRRVELIMPPDEAGQATFVAGDITDLGAIERALGDHAITNVIHLAALQVPFCRADPPLGARVNVVGTVNMFEAVRRRGDAMAPVVYTSSVGMYVASDADPASGALLEGADAHPANHYGVYKLANEGNARVYWSEAGVSSIGLRPLTVFGPGRDQGMTSGPTVAIAAAVLGLPYRIGFGGSTVFQYAEDVARTIVLASRSGLAGARVYNLGGNVVSIEDWIAAIEALVPGAAGLVTSEGPPLPFPTVIDHAGLDVLGDVPVTPWRDAVAATVDRFLALAAGGRLVAADQGVPVPAT